jgi:predicted ArsR family transcriptional regulator
MFLEMKRKLDAVTHRPLRETLLFARSRALPVTADDVADAQAIHRNVARSRLERLTEAGLLIPGFERRTGRVGPGSGRPAKTYRVAPEFEAIQFPERHWERLIVLVANALPERGRSRRLQAIGREFGRELARQARLRPAQGLRAAADRVCSALARLGFQASVTAVDDDAAVITTPTCPLRPLVSAEPNLAELDRGLWSGLLGEALGRASQARIHCDTAGCSERADCRIVLRLTGAPARG